jgi:membrane protein DedA with SNARE-associated domain
MIVRLLPKVSLAVVGCGGVISSSPHPAVQLGVVRERIKAVCPVFMALEFVQQLPELIGSAVEKNPFTGYAAIFGAMFLENLFPPIPSEVIMPLGGFYVQQGKLSLIPVVLAGLLGTVLGALPWYGIGRLVNEERIEQWLARHGRWIGIRPQELQRSRTWFNRHGTALVFWGRLIPGIRTLISVPAGIEMMPLAPFLVWTTAGSLIWTLLLTLAGLALGEGYSRVELWIEPVAKVVKVVLVVAFLAGLVWLGLRIWKKRADTH